VNPAKGASQKGFCSCTLYDQKKTNYSKDVKKHHIFTTLIFYRKVVMQLNHYMKLFHSNANTKNRVRRGEAQTVERRLAVRQARV
jgi:hypothetical protein